MKTNVNRYLVENSDLVIGRQPVLSVLKHGSPYRVIMASGQSGRIIDDIVTLAREKGIPVDFLPGREFRELFRSHRGHQGVAAVVPPFQYRSFHELLEQVKPAGEPVLVALDHVEDPQNLGSILRTVDAAGVPAVIIPEHRAAAVTPAVRKAAAGAVERLNIVRVANLARSLTGLKEAGYWVYGAEIDGTAVYNRVDYRRPLVLVFGSEGRGLSPLVRRYCDLTISIPIRKEAASLNVSVAAAILLFAAVAQRERDLDE